LGILPLYILINKNDIADPVVVNEYIQDKTSILILIKYPYLLIIAHTSFIKVLSDYIKNK